MMYSTIARYEQYVVKHYCAGEKDSHFCQHPMQK